MGRKQAEMKVATVLRVVNRLYAGLFGNRSLQKKLMLSYMMIILPFLCACLITTDRIGRDMEAQALTREENDVLQLKENISNYFNRYIDLSTDVYFDKRILEYFLIDFKNRGDSAEGFYTLLNPTFLKYKNLWPEIAKITVFTKNPSLMSNNDEITYIDEASPEWNTYRETIESGGKILWKVYRDEEGRYQIRLNRILLLNNIEVGMLSIFIDQEPLNDFFKTNMTGSEVYIVGPNGFVFGTTRPQLLGAESTFEAGNLQSSIDISGINENGETFKVVKTAMHLGKYSPDPWMIVKTVPIDRIMREVNHTRTFLFIVFVIALAFGIGSSILIAHHLGSRVRSLAKRMKKVQEGNFDVEVPVKHQDEIGYLSRSFNKMVRRLNDLIHELYTMKIQKMEMEVKRREAEWNALQSQINPHFLFNTLEAILWGIQENRKESAEVVQLLAKSFRRVIQWDDDFIPLASEIQFIEEYLFIQKFRLQDKLTWRIRIDEPLLSMFIPKMMIQPIIENAIHHGISMKKGNGVLSIDIIESDGGVIMRFQDDGEGMKPEKLTQVLLSLEAPPSKAGGRHIGLRNVYERMKLYFGEETAFSIRSDKGVGTVVELKIPPTRRIT